jgi:hypothetical protein
LIWGSTVLLRGMLSTKLKQGVTWSILNANYCFALFCRCGCLLSCNDFCVHASQFFKHILQRYSTYVHFVSTSAFFSLACACSCFSRKRHVAIAVADHDFAVSHLNITTKHSQDTLKCIEVLNFLLFSLIL